MCLNVYACTRMCLLFLCLNFSAVSELSSCGHISLLFLYLNVSAVSECVFMQTHKSAFPVYKCFWCVWMCLHAHTHVPALPVSECFWCGWLCLIGGGWERNHGIRYLTIFGQWYGNLSKFCSIFGIKTTLQRRKSVISWQILKVQQ